MSNNLPEKILIVDDDPTVAESLKDPLGRHNIKVIGASDLDTALYQYNNNRLDVVLVEHEFEPNPGLVLIQKWRKHDMHEKRFTGFILLSGNVKGAKAGDTALLQELQDIEVLAKPVAAIQLLPVLARAKATKIRNLKVEETRQVAFKMGASEGKLDKAADIIRRQMNELGSKGLEMLAQLYEDHNRVDDALGVVAQLIDAEPRNMGWLNMKGRLLLKKGDHKEALKVMEQADREAPNNIERINALAVAYLEAKQPDKSVEKMHELIKFNPENPDLRFEFFSKLHEHGFDTHAQELCRKTTGPLEVVRYYNNKGVALSKVGNTAGALTEYERSLQYYPKFKENYRILYNIALAHTSHKTRPHYEIALEFLDKCLALKPEFEKAAKTKETVQRILGKVPAAS